MVHEPSTPAERGCLNGQVVVDYIALNINHFKPTKIV